MFTWIHALDIDWLRFTEAIIANLIADVLIGVGLLIWASIRHWHVRIIRRISSAPSSISPPPGQPTNL